jgi:hypothetical protein
VASEAAQPRSRDDQVRNLVPLFAFAVAVVAAVTDPSSRLDVVLMAIPVMAFGLWTYQRETPLALVAVGVLVPTVLAQRSGSHEPLMFEASLLAIVVGRWSESLALYRIAQEALANAARHAPRARTVLGLEVFDEHVSLVAETSGPVLAPPQGEWERTRYGLIGMRERATALGGEFSAGPTPGGWRVSCRLPLQGSLGATA